MHNEIFDTIFDVSEGGVASEDKFYPICQGYAFKNIHQYEFC